MASLPFRHHPPVHVFFFRGLSTYGHDRAKWSIFDFGPVYKHLERELRTRGIEFHPVLGMGAGTLLEVAARARKFLKSHPQWHSAETPVNFLGHSTGGVIARLLLAPDPQSDAEPALVTKGKVASCLTVASPNRGSELAQICLDMPRDFRGSTKVLSSLGYDIADRAPFFYELTRRNLNNVIPQTEPPAWLPRAGSIVCHLPRAEFCRPLRWFYKVPAFASFVTPSDGVVERDSQPFGEVVAELPIDHFRQVGLFGAPEKFTRLCDVIADYFLNH